MATINFFDFLKSHPKQAVEWIARFGKISTNFLTKVGKHTAFWNEVGRNLNMAWTEDLLKQYKPFCTTKFYEGLGENTAVQWTETIIITYLNKWWWYALCANTSIDCWSNVIFTAAANKMQWNVLLNNPTFVQNTYLYKKNKNRYEYSNYLSPSEMPFWTADLIEQHQTRVNWASLSLAPNVAWSAALLEQFADKWTWDYLSKNEYLPWSIDLIEQFKTRWNKNELSANPHLPWADELIDKFIDSWNFPYLSNNVGIDWYLERFYKYHDHFAEWAAFPIHLRRYEGLFFNNTRLENYISEVLGKEKMVTKAVTLQSQDKTSSTVFTIEVLGGSAMNVATYQNHIAEYFLADNAAYLTWGGISNNQAMQWTAELIAEFENRWNWAVLSSNPSLPWSVKLLERFKDKWSWKDLSKNPALPWSVELIQPFVDRWNWSDLSKNEHLVWTKELFLAFYKHWEGREIAHKIQCPLSEIMPLYTGNTSSKHPDSAIVQFVPRSDWQQAFDALTEDQLLEILQL